MKSQSLLILLLFFSLSSQNSEAQLDLDNKQGPGSFFEEVASPYISIGFTGEARLGVRNRVALRRVIPDEHLLLSDYFARELELNSEQKKEFESIRNEIDIFKQDFLKQIRSSEFNFEASDKKFEMESSRVSKRFQEVLLPEQVQWLNQTRGIIRLRSIGFLNYSKEICMADDELDWDRSKKQFRKVVQEIKAGFSSDLAKIQEDFESKCIEAFSEEVIKKIDSSYSHIPIFNDLALCELAIYAKDEETVEDYNELSLLEFSAIETKYVWKNGVGSWTRVETKGDKTVGVFRIEKILKSALDAGGKEFFTNEQTANFANITSRWNLAVEKTNKEFRNEQRSANPDTHRLNLIQKTSEEVEEKLALEFIELLTKPQEKRLRKLVAQLRQKQKGLVCVLIESGLTDGIFSTEAELEMFKDDAIDAMKASQKSLLDLEKKYLDFFLENVDDLYAKKIRDSIGAAPNELSPAIMQFGILFREEDK